MRQDCIGGYGDMSKQASDLIQRAAARLQRARGDALGAPAAAKLETAAGGSTNIAHSIEAFSRQIATPEQQSERKISINPAVLAANGIALPSGAPSRTTEEFRALKRYVLTNALRNRGASNAVAKRVILVTSARPGDGKTFTAVNLALALAYERNARVLLFDADAYRQSLMTFLGISADFGWLDVVSGGMARLGDAAIQTDIPGFSVLPSGKERAEIPELMASHQMQRLIDQLVAEDPARFILIDSLPCLASTEPSILAELSSQTLFVVAAQKTSREDVEASLRLLQASPSVGLVLNKAEPLLTEQFEGYGYGYGYGN